MGILRIPLDFTNKIILEDMGEGGHPMSALLKYVAP